MAAEMKAENVKTANRFAKLEGRSDRSFISYIYQYILSYIYHTSRPRDSRCVLLFAIN